MDDDLERAFAAGPAPPELHRSAVHRALLDRMFGVATPKCRLGDYELVRCLGSGASGVVYEARHVTTGERVALKTLLHLDARSLLRLKDEFRTAAELRHDNLVELYELAEHDGQPYFTMQLIEGVDLRRHLDMTPGGPARDLVRVRRSFGDLTAGVRALHDAGRLHLDIKPSNVMVTRGGRTILLDLGLARPRAPDPLGAPMMRTLGGTPAYMAPEQAREELQGPAADWYAFGAVLYEALTGVLPHPARELAAVLHAKRAEPPALVADAPDDLGRLCVGLLDPEPARRPAADEILACFETPRDPGGTHWESSEGGRFVGRVAELRALQDALSRSRAPQTVVRYLTGPPGIGKTELVRRFVAGLAEQAPDTVVLAGRCYERDSTPYRGFDSVVDALARYLGTLPTEQVVALLPRNVDALARLFPALHRVRAVTRAPRRTVDDPVELRRRAFGALVELLARIGDRTRLVVFLDDFHWGDEDSARLLYDLIAGTDSPAMLLVVAYRPDDASRSAELREFPPRDLPGTVDLRTIEVGPLSHEDARALAAAWLGDDVAQRIAMRVAAEGRGNALVTAHLARGVRAGNAIDDIGLERLVERRLAELPAGCSDLMRTLAVAGAPLRRAVAFSAARLDDTARTVESALCAAKLARRCRLGSHAALEAYHDRIREVVASELSDATRRASHRALAEALEAVDNPEPSTLAMHWAEAGEHRRAAEHAHTAARRAAHGLAFERAATLYRFALRHGVDRLAQRASLCEELGRALANAGRGPEAAEAYLQAADEMPPAVASELRRRAAEQLLHSGHVERGRAVLGRALADVGMRIPSTKAGAAWGTLTEHVALRIRGLSFRARPAEEIAEDQLRRIDLCEAVASGLVGTDMLGAAAMYAQGLRLALRAGETSRIARLLAYHAMQRGFLGLAGAGELLTRARALADETGQPHTIAVAALTRAAVTATEGRWHTVLELTTDAITRLEADCPGAYWELSWARFYREHALFWLGRLREAHSSMARSMADASARGDKLAVSTRRLSGMWALASLAADEPERAEAELARGQADWGRETFDLQAWYASQARTLIALYRDDPEAAWEILHAHRGPTQRLAARASAAIRVTTSSRRGGVALALALCHDGGARRRTATQEAGALTRVGRPWAEAFAQTLLAGVAVQESRAHDGHTHLDRAIELFDATGMRLYGAAVRRRKGELLGGSRGTELIRQADATMSGEGIAVPARACELFAPGFPR